MKKHAVVDKTAETQDRKCLKFQIKYAKISHDLEVKSKDCAGRNATDDYTFFRERESPAESSLKVR